jgi:hypothetical protein
MLLLLLLVMMMMMMMLMMTVCLQLGVRGGVVYSGSQVDTSTTTEGEVEGGSEGDLLIELVTCET